MGLEHEDGFSLKPETQNRREIVWTRQSGRWINKGGSLIYHGATADSRELAELAGQIAAMGGIEYYGFTTNRELKIESVKNGFLNLCYVTFLLPKKKIMVGIPITE